MQNKGSALAFVFVLFVMCLGGYAAFTTLARGRSDAVIPAASRTPPTGAEIIATSSIPAPTSTPEAAASPHSELSTPVVPTATPVPPPSPTQPPQPTPTATPSPTRPAAEPTPAPPSGSHQFYVIRNERDCAPGGIIGGWVYDADNNGLPWARIKLYTEGWSASKQSEGPPQSGKYEFPMGYDAALFHLLIVDDNDQPLSAVIDIDYRPGGSYCIDWQRVH